MIPFQLQIFLYFQKPNNFRHFCRNSLPPCSGVIVTVNWEAPPLKIEQTSVANDGEKMHKWSAITVTLQWSAVILLFYVSEPLINNGEHKIAYLSYTFNYC